MDDDISCPICLEVFKRPLRLECAHTFCKACLQQLSKKESTITCPLCRMEMRLGKKGVKKLQRNLTMMRAVKKQKKSVNTESIFQSIFSSRRRSAPAAPSQTLNHPSEFIPVDATQASSPPQALQGTRNHDGTLNHEGTLNHDGTLNHPGTANLDGSTNHHSTLNNQSTANLEGTIHHQGITHHQGTTNNWGTTNLDGSAHHQGTTNLGGTFNNGDTTNLGGTTNLEGITNHQRSHNSAPVSLGLGTGTQPPSFQDLIYFMMDDCKDEDIPALFDLVEQIVQSNNFTPDDDGEGNVDTNTQSSPNGVTASGSSSSTAQDFGNIMHLISERTQNSLSSSTHPIAATSAGGSTSLGTVLASAGPASVPASVTLARSASVASAGSASSVEGCLEEVTAVPVTHASSSMTLPASSSNRPTIPPRPTSSNQPTIPPRPSPLPSAPPLLLSKFSNVSRLRANLRPAPLPPSSSSPSSSLSFVSSMALSSSSSSMASSSSSSMESSAVLSPSPSVVCPSSSEVSPSPSVVSPSPSAVSPSSSVVSPTEGNAANNPPPLPPRPKLKSLKNSSTELQSSSSSSSSPSLASSSHNQAVSPLSSSSTPSSSHHQVASPRRPSSPPSFSPIRPSSSPSSASSSPRRPSSSPTSSASPTRPSSSPSVPITPHRPVAKPRSSLTSAVSPPLPPLPQGKNKHLPLPRKNLPLPVPTTPHGSHGSETLPVGSQDLKEYQPHCTESEKTLSHPDPQSDESFDAGDYDICTSGVFQELDRVLDQEEHVYSKLNQTLVTSSTTQTEPQYLSYIQPTPLENQSCNVMNSVLPVSQLVMDDHETHFEPHLSQNEDMMPDGVEINSTQTDPHAEITPKQVQPPSTLHCTQQEPHCSSNDTTPTGPQSMGNDDGNSIEDLDRAILQIGDIMENLHSNFINNYKA